MAEDVPLYQTFLWASSTVCTYLAALFHVTDFRVTVTISSRPRKVAAPLTALSLYQSECSPLLSFIYSGIKSSVASPEPWCVRSRRGRERYQRWDKNCADNVCESLLSTRKESCAWRLDCTVLLGHLWSLAMTLPPSPFTAWACLFHSMKQLQTGEMKSTSSLHPNSLKDGILPGIHLSPRFLCCSEPTYLHQQQIQWYVLLLFCPRRWPGPWVF